MTTAFTYTLLALAGVGSFALPEPIAAMPNAQARPRATSIALSGSLFTISDPQVTQPDTPLPWMTRWRPETITTRPFSITLIDDGSGIFSYHNNAFRPAPDGYRSVGWISAQASAAADQVITIESGCPVWLVVNHQLVSTPADRPIHVALSEFGSDPMPITIVFAHTDATPTWFRLHTNAPLTPKRR